MPPNLCRAYYCVVLLRHCCKHDSLLLHAVQATHHHIGRVGNCPISINTLEGSSGSRPVCGPSSAHVIGHVT